MGRGLAAGLALLLSAAVWGAASAAETARCSAIDDDADRLTCYDEKDEPRAAGGEADKRRPVSFSGGFVTYRPTYILPFTWVDSPNDSPQSPRLGAAGYDYGLKNQEAKYQISFKVPLLTGVLDERTTLWFGYTQLSLWQVYNPDESAPFRETNFEPELFFQHRSGYDIGGGEIESVALGFNHQSNGRSDPLSRSWNRVMGSVSYRCGRWHWQVRPWYRLPEDGDDDDNEDIDRYLGYASYRVEYRWEGAHRLSLKLFNNLRTHDNRTSVELGYSFPIGGAVKGYLQYYNGYGESLADYNRRIRRIGIGIMMGGD